MLVPVVSRTPSPHFGGEGGLVLRPPCSTGRLDGPLVDVISSVAAKRGVTQYSDVCGTENRLPDSALMRRVDEAEFHPMPPSELIV